MPISGKEAVFAGNPLFRQKSGQKKPELPKNRSVPRNQPPDLWFHGLGPRNAAAFRRSGGAFRRHGAVFPGTGRRSGVPSAGAVVTAPRSLKPGAVSQIRLVEYGLHPVEPELRRAVPRSISRVPHLRPRVPGNFFTGPRPRRTVPRNIFLGPQLRRGVPWSNSRVPDLRAGVPRNSWAGPRLRPAVPWNSFVGPRLRRAVPRNARREGWNRRRGGFFMTAGFDPVQRAPGSAWPFHQALLGWPPGERFLPSSSSGFKASAWPSTMTRLTRPPLRSEGVARRVSSPSLPPS